MTKQGLRLAEVPDLLTVHEVARVLRIGRNTAYALVRSGRVRSLRIGRAVRVPKEALRRFLEEGGALGGDAA